MKTLSLNWFISVLVIELLLAACSNETPVVQQTVTEQPKATIALQEIPTAQPEALPETEAQTATEVNVPKISQPVAQWNAVSEQGNWVLIRYGDTLNPTIVEPGTYITINFRVTDNQAYGSGGCNNFFTTYTADDDLTLTINSPVGVTKMACESGMEQERMFLGALETVTGYIMTDQGYLLLDYDSGTDYEEKLAFITENALVDTVWVLTAYGQPGNLTPSELGVITTAVFSADGTLNGNSGCNIYAAGYQLQENQISISLPLMNLMACEKGMEQEQTFLQLLQIAQSYRLSMSALEITTSNGSAMRFNDQDLHLENVRWLLASVDGQTVPEGVNANVLFTPAGSPADKNGENSVNGGAGCNTFFGSYSLAGDIITTGPFDLSQMTCEVADMQIERAFLAGLESAQIYQITHNHLIINTATGSLLLYADRMPLEGPQWILTRQGDIENPQPPIEGAAFTSSFTRQFGMPSGVKSGGTGCNDYSATYFATSDEIKVNLQQTSENVCTDAQMDAEQSYFLGLNAARDYRILGNEMQIFYDDYVLIFEGSYPESETGPLAVLDGTVWWLAAIDTFAVLPGSEVTIAFAINPDGKTGAISGSGGCNTYSAEITNVFMLDPINVPTVLCDMSEGVMDQESAYLNVLQNANDVWIEGNTLRITTNFETLYFTNIGPTPKQSQPIMAVINAPSNGAVDELITFDGSESSSNVDITSYQWDYGDGASGEGIKIGHTYNLAGIYDVILIIGDAKGKTAKASMQITIK